MAIKISLLYRPSHTPGGDITLCLDAAKAAEDAGLYGIHFGDHIMVGNHPENYPFGKFIHEPSAPWPEPITLLSAMAAVTSRIRLSTGILLSPLRAPMMLAKSIATLDVISRGRIELGLGVGWQPEEYEAVGLPWEKRYAAFDTGVRACRAIWGEQPVTFDEPGIKLDRGWVYPLPTQKRIPLMFGLAPTPKNLERIALYGDGWCPVMTTPAQLREGCDRLAEILARHGRSMDEMLIRVSIPYQRLPDDGIDLDKTFDLAGQYREAGATILGIATPQYTRDMDDVRAHIAQVAHRATLC